MEVPQAGFHSQPPSRAQSAPAGYEQGHWLAPTVLDAVAQDSPCAREELFGPVLGVTTFAAFIWRQLTYRQPLFVPLVEEAREGWRRMAGRPGTADARVRDIAAPDSG